MYANVKKCEIIITNNYIRIKYPPPPQKKSNDLFRPIMYHCQKGLTGLDSICYVASPIIITQQRCIYRNIE